MRKLFLGLATWLLLCQGASATTSTIDPTKPEYDDDVDSYTIRTLAQAAYNDINTAFAQISALSISLLVAGGIPGGIEWNHNGALDSFVARGDCTINPAIGNVSCASINGLNPFNASNINSGVLSPNQLPLPTSNTVGAVKSASASAHNFATGINTSGALTFAQPAAGDVSGLAASATTDTTNAANITSGTLALARIAANIFTSTLAGLVPASGGGTTNYLRADGTWASPPGGVGNPNVSNATGVLPVPNGGTGSSSGNAYNLYAMPVPQASAYDAHGDSITCGSGGGNVSLCSTTTPNTNGYANLLANDVGAALTNYGISGEQGCDDADFEVFAHENPSETNNVLYTVMIGINDSSNRPAPTSYENVYRACHQAILSWLAIPSNYKTFAQNCTASGSWTAYNGWVSGVGYQAQSTSAQLNCSITTYGGPIYIWYRSVDGSSTTFTYHVDSGSSTSVAVASSPAIGPTFSNNTTGVMLIRIPGVSAGTHTVNIAESSGINLTVAGVGTPAPYPYYKGPRVFVGDVSRQLNGINAVSNDAYNAESLADWTLLGPQGDGLPLYWVPVRNYWNDTTDMQDNTHPNASGHGHIRDAFAAAMQFVPAVSNQSPASSAACTKGQAAFDSSFIYICTASGAWKRAALTGGF